jgi:hypothetical protein
MLQLAPGLVLCDYLPSTIDFIDYWFGFYSNIVSMGNYLN